MASNYPTSLDNFSNPAGTDSLNSPSHSLQHTDANDAIEALQAKVGIGASPAGSATAGQVLTAQGGGTALWQDIPDNAGLVHINTTTIASGSPVASQSINDVFSATYRNYRIIGNVKGSTSRQFLGLRLRASGTDTTTGYFRSLIQSNSGTLGVTYDISATSMAAAGVGDFTDHYFTIDIFSPYLAQATGILQQSVLFDSGGNSVVFGTGNMPNTTVYDGFTLLPVTSGTFFGEIRTYGITNG